MALPLDGLRVIDCSRLMPFSYSTQLLVELGADVVKVEAPGGEYGRGMPEVFELTNRGKRSITLDLRTAQGQRLLREMVSGFDALLETFRPGFMTGLSLGYDVLASLHPPLVYCSATGFGQTGPYADRPGHDVTYAALAGLLAPVGGQPEVAQIPYIDMAAGWAAALALVAGVYEARRTGHGRHLDVGMADVALSFNLLAVAYVQPSPAAPGLVDQELDQALSGYPWPDLMRQGCPCYGVFETRDGSFIALANVEPKFWNAFLQAVRRPEFAGDRFAVGDRARQVRSELDAVLRSRTLTQWLEAFKDSDVCYAPVNSAAAAMCEPQFQIRGVAVRRRDGRWHVGSPLNVLGGREPSAAAMGDAPEPGADTVAVLGELGYDVEQVRQWRSEGVL